MPQKVRITVTIPDNEPVSGRAVSNAVRRSLFEVESLASSGTVKDVSFSVKETKPDTSLKGVRQWAAKKGIKLGKRGRIPREVLAQYAASN